MLTIYRASAGAGKTHILTGEYLRLLFSGIDAHAGILSVTFTNKATDEMKKRIIEELHLLASGRPSVFLSTLMTKNRKTEDEIRRQAHSILNRILHDYAKFQICTIDHFFQQTIRAFIRETGINGNYHIEMDTDLVLSESVDNLLADLDIKENRELLQWLLRFGEDKVEKGENWELRNEIKKLANELFKEKYKSYSDRLEKDITDKQALAEYQDTLYAIIHATETEAKRIGEAGISVLQQHNLQPSDFKGVSRSPLFFFVHLSKGGMKEPTETFKNLADNLEACYTKTTKPDMINTIETAFNNGLNDCILHTIHFFDHLTNYYTAKEIVRNFYTLGILTDIARHIREWREEKNRLLIADTNELLDKVINGSDVPFIYEKTGTYIDHFMIDEFQDTSRMQWRNFRPLIKESLACRRPNLIVGDIKQSIYRFRNSDWTLLDEQVQTDFSPQEVIDLTLNENWRSHRLIVEFNNAFFDGIPCLLQEIFNQGLEESALEEQQKKLYASRIVSAYQHSFQHVSPPRQSRDGHIRVEFLPENDECNWKQEAMNRLPALIEKLQAQGYTLQDIAILVRTNIEGASVADTLLAYKEAHPESPWKYDIISEDALIIANSFSVRFIVSMLTYLNRPHDPTLKQLALMTHAVMLAKSQSVLNMKYTFGDMTSGFSEEVIREIQHLSHRSFYETVEAIYRLFKTDFPENEQVFVQAFLDLAATFTEKEPADMDQFLRWWDESGHKEKIRMPDTQNAIRILTIHKSKGLGFKAVIIPFGDWDMDQKSESILWCHPQKAPFDKLSVVPVNYSKQLSKTLFAEDYYREKLHAYIDNLNALYVAFTRAKEELIVFTPNVTVKRRKEVSKLIGDTLMTDALSKGLNLEEGFFEWGGWWYLTPSPCVETGEIPMLSLPSILPDERIFLRLHRNGSFIDDAKRKYGILMHEILSHIQTGTDIRKAIMDREMAGEINNRESAELTERLERLLDLPEVKKWFDGSMHVMNETEILYGNGKSYRPDRIMFDNEQVIVVDYKFGSQENLHDRQQVKKYMSLIQESGYQDVTGYLWYIELNKIVPVSGGD